MITQKGTSKDPNLVPEGIVITMGKEMIMEKGGLKKFIEWFDNIMSEEDGYFLHKCRFAPKYEIDHVYIIIANRLYGRVYYGGYSKGPVEAYLHPEDPVRVMIEWPHLKLAGPLVKCPFRREIRGFRQFRYSQKLF